MTQARISPAPAPFYGLLLASLLLASSVGVEAVETRQVQMVAANMNGVHAYQLLLYRKERVGDPAAWQSNLTDEQLLGLAQHHRELLKDWEAAAAWVRGEETTFDPQPDLIPLLESPARPEHSGLPATVLVKHLSAQPGASGGDTLCVASLLQLMFEVERDADEVQFLFALYAAAGMRTHWGQLGLQALTDDELLKMAGPISADIAQSPFDTDATTLRMLLRKMWTWGRRYAGERDSRTLAGELAGSSEVGALAAALSSGSLRFRRVAVIGHSYTMNMHWSSPSSFARIAGNILEARGLAFRQWERGGLRASIALKDFYKEASAWSPDYVLLAMAERGTEDLAALEAMVVGFRKAGVHVAMFDSLTGKETRPKFEVYPATDAISAIAARTGMQVIPAGDVLDADAARPLYLSLDGIHMTEPYHMRMARIWISSLVDSQPEGR